MFAVVKWGEDGLLIGMACSLISIRSLDLGGEFLIGYNSYELGRSEWMAFSTLANVISIREMSFQTCYQSRMSVSQLRVE
jgi:hypothetical protein